MPGSPRREALFFVKALAIIAALVLSLAWPSEATAYAVLAHEAIIDSAWVASIRPLLLRGDRELRAYVNQGRPPIAATQRPGSFRGSDVRPAREAGGRYEPPPNRGANREANNHAARPDNNANRPPNARNNSGRPPFAHARDIAPHEKPAPPNSGNPKRDQKYRQQQDKLYAKQEQDHQKLQQRQEQDHQRLARQNAPEPKRQHVEQRHQQQTQQLEQRHTQQQQRIQEKQQPQRQSGSGGKPDRP
jgi:hypothetical protein